MNWKGSKNAKASVAKNTAIKMLSMPFCAYCVQMATTFLESDTEAFSELSRLICSGGDRLHGCAREPINHRAAGNQTQQEGRVEDREVGKVGRQTVSERHDDREDHSSGAHDRGADQHRLGGSLEGVAGPVVLFQIFLALLEVRFESEIALDLGFDARQRLDGRKLEHGLGVIGHWAVTIHRDGDRTHT